jgi:lipoate-protein ligase A
MLAVHADPVSGANWSVEHHVGSAADLHQLVVPAARSLLVLEVTRPAMVLGSTQSDDVVDHRAASAAGVDVVRRRSGGGAVLLVPGEHVWLDVVLPADDPLWVHDVETSSWWLGEAWAAAIAGVAPAGSPLDVHRHGVTDRELGRRVCFAATGPGEVSVGGRKLVGLSQRRTREVARFQCVVHRRFDRRSTVALLADDGRSVELDRALRVGVADLGSLGVEPGWSVVEDLLARLP